MEEALNPEPKSVSAYDPAEADESRAALAELNKRLADDFVRNIEAPLTDKLDSLSKLTEEWEQNFVGNEEEEKYICAPRPTSTAEEEKIVVESQASFPCDMNEFPFSAFYLLDCEFQESGVKLGKIRPLLVGKID